MWTLDFGIAFGKTGADSTHGVKQRQRALDEIKHSLSARQQNGVLGLGMPLARPSVPVSLSRSAILILRGLFELEGEGETHRSGRSYSYRGRGWLEGL